MPSLFLVCIGRLEFEISHIAFRTPQSSNTRVHEKYAWGNKRRGALYMYKREGIGEAHLGDSAREALLRVQIRDVPAERGREGADSLGGG